MVARYLRQLLAPFFQWWWAALTGVFTILGALWAPTQGITLGRGMLATLIFILSTLLFLILSLITVSWRWFTKTSLHPVVLDIKPEETNKTPLTFIVKAGYEEIPPGSLLALFRRNEYDVEVCAAILEVKSARTDGRGLQAEAKWITPLHKTWFQKKSIRLTDIELRIVDAQALSLVEKCVKGE